MSNNREDKDKDLKTFLKNLAEAYAAGDMISVNTKKSSKNVNKTTNTKSKVFVRFDKNLADISDECNNYYNNNKYQIPYLNMSGTIPSIAMYLNKKFKLDKDNRSNLNESVKKMAIFSMVYALTTLDRKTVHSNNTNQSFDVLSGFYSTDSVQELFNQINNIVSLFGKIALDFFLDSNSNNTINNDETLRVELEKSFFNYITQFTNLDDYFNGTYTTLSYESWKQSNSQKSLKKVKDTGLRIIDFTQTAIQMRILSEKKFEFPDKLKLSSSLNPLERGGDKLAYSFSNSIKKTKTASSSGTKSENKKVKTFEDIRKNLSKNFKKYFKGTDDDNYHKLLNRNKFINISSADLENGTKFTLSDKKNTTAFVYNNISVPVKLSADSITSDTGNTPLFKLLVSTIGFPSGSQKQVDQNKISNNVRSLFEIFEVDLNNFRNMNFIAQGSTNNNYENLLQSNLCASVVNSPNVVRYENVEGGSEV